MKELYYDAEGDILTVNFLPTEAKKETGIEITDNIVLYFDTIDEKPLQMILVSYSRLVEHTRQSPLKLDKLAKYPKRLQRIALKLIQHVPVSHFLELKTSDADVHGLIRVKKIALKPEILEEQFGAHGNARPFKQEDILQGIEAAEKLLESGFSEAALMLAWSISEAAIRLLIEAEGISFDRLTPLYILKQAVTNGVISREDYNFLTKMMKHRNALAHGFKTIDFDPALVKELVSTTKRLAQQSTTVHLEETLSAFPPKSKAAQRKSKKRSVGVVI